MLFSPILHNSTIQLKSHYCSFQLHSTSILISPYSIKFKEYELNSPSISNYIIQAHQSHIFWQSIMHNHL